VQCCMSKGVEALPHNFVAKSWRQAWLSLVTCYADIDSRAHVRNLILSKPWDRRPAHVEEKLKQSSTSSSGALDGERYVKK